MFIKYKFSKGEILDLYKNAEDRCRKTIEDVISFSGKRTFENTVEKLELAYTDYSDVVSKLGFMGYVSIDENSRKEAMEVEELSSKFSAWIGSKREIYLAFVDYLSHKENLTPTQQRIVDLNMMDFKRDGMDLPEEIRERIKKIRERLGELSAKYQSNINENNDFIELSEEETEGLSNDFKERLERVNGKYKVPLKQTFYKPLMSNATKSDVRKRAYIAYNNIEARRNIVLLEEAINLKHEHATLLGYKTHVDYETEEEIMKTKDNVHKFLTSLKEKLRSKTNLEIKKLEETKKKDVGTSKLDPWDIDYYFDKIKKKEYEIDNEKIKEYFPLDHVIEGMFKVYSKLLNVSFHKVENADTWADHVSLYEVMDSTGLVSHFYMDLYPREGKYNHAAAFTLTKGRFENGKYVKPVSAIVANFTAPTKTKPSIITHDEVTTLFHEFGHIMHQTLTKAYYAKVSGTSTTTDFVEAPSQVMENWCWKEEILPLISKHYKNENVLPKDLLDKMISSRTYNSGFFWTRQIFLATLDYRYHTLGSNVNTTKVYNDTFKEFFNMDLPDVHMQANFGHIMGGYDGKYYSYIYSIVLAADMFRLFENRLLDSDIGMKYRKEILERGHEIESDELVRQFLGRNPDESEFLRQIGIN